MFGFDLSEYITAQEIQNAENPWLNQKYLQTMIEHYLSQRLGVGTYIIGEDKQKTLRLNAEARNELREDFRRLPASRNAVRQNWDFYLRGKYPMRPITFDSETAAKRRDAFFITASHPLAKQAAAYYASNETSYISFRVSTDDLPAGKYLFSIYAWKYVGMKPHFRLVAVSENNEIAEVLPSLLQEAALLDPNGEWKPLDWSKLEEKQVKMWMEEKAKAVSDANQIYKYRFESLTNNHTNKVRSLERAIATTEEERVRRMHMSELEKCNNLYKTKIEEIRKNLAQTDIHTALLANGILEVVSE